MNALLIFDFDGVIADSEVLANAVLAEVVTELGVPTTLEDSYRHYMGKRFDDVMAAVEAVIGRKLPEDFPGDYQARTLARFRRELAFVTGARDYIEAFSHLPMCIASSSSPDRLAVCLEVLDLQSIFGGCVFSASQVERGKPHPDIFLFAAEQMNIPPSRAIVVEDSVSGVQAAIAAGMTVVGLTAASHIRDGHAARLAEAGAQHVATSFREAAALTHGILGRLQA